MTEHDRAIESRKASVRAKVEHPFLIVTRDFGFTKTRYRGIGKNLHHLHMLFASANWLMRARAVTLTADGTELQPARNRADTAQRGPKGEAETVRT